MTRTITLPKRQGYGSSHTKGSWNSFPETIMLEIFNRYKQSNEKKFSFESFLYQVAQNPTTIHKRFHEELLSLVLDLPETNITPYKNMSLILNIYTTEELQKMLTQYLQAKRSNVIWMVRELERMANSLLIDEEDNWI